ncbi:hypothetical protein AGLY_017023, partial [Aphis glycines]
MAQKSALSFSTISNYFKINQKQLKRGELSFLAEYISKINFDPDGLIKGDVKAILSVHGQEDKAFVSTLLLSTDLPCTWNTRKPNNDVEVQSIKDIYPSKPYTATNSIPDDSIDRFKQSQACIGMPIGVMWLLKPEPLIPPPKICSLISIEEKLLVKLKMIYGLFTKKHRLTASNFGDIISAMKKKSIPKSLLKSLNNEYGSIKHVRAIEWGLANESTAVNILQETENIIVQPTGLWLHQCGFIGASPDGLLGEDDIVEVKCSYKYRKCKLSDAITEDQSYIIYKINNEIFINKHHNYWHQIQGQPFMTKRINCGVLRNGGIFRWTPFGKISLIKNPLSAKTKSPSSSCANKLLCKVRILSDVEPENRLLQNVTIPFGATPIRAFKIK